MLKTMRSWLLTDCIAEWQYKNQIKTQTLHHWHKIINMNKTIHYNILTHLKNITARNKQIKITVINQLLDIYNTNKRICTNILKKFINKYTITNNLQMERNF